VYGTDGNLVAISVLVSKQKKTGNREKKKEAAPMRTKTKVRAGNIIWTP
jgi:hypothetical protein